MTSLYSARQVVPMGPSSSMWSSPSTARRSMGTAAKSVTVTPYSSARARTSSSRGMSWSARKL